jgi:hypothetical protein
MVPALRQFFVAFLPTSGTDLRRTPWRHSYRIRPGAFSLVARLEQPDGPRGIHDRFGPVASRQAFDVQSFLGDEIVAAHQPFGHVMQVVLPSTRGSLVGAMPRFSRLGAVVGPPLFAR